MIKDFYFFFRDVPAVDAFDFFARGLEAFAEVFFECYKYITEMLSPKYYQC